MVDTMETILIVIIILLTFVMWKKTKPAATETISSSRSGSGVRVEHAHDCKCPKCFNPEKGASIERMEYYGNRAAGCDTCDPHSDLSYAKFDYGSSSADFKDYIAGEAISPQVVKNHNEFVNDRLGDFQTQNVTGRTFAVDTTIEGNPPVPWVGIRGRPQEAPIYNPTQMPDVDRSRYVSKQKLVWNTNTEDTYY